MQIIPALSLILDDPGPDIPLTHHQLAFRGPARRRDHPAFLGMAGDDMPAVGWLHGLVAFGIFVLAGLTGQRATERTRTRTSMAVPD